MDSAVISWSVNSIDMIDEFKSAHIVGSVSGSSDVHSKFEIVFMDGLPFPARFKMEISASYTTDDGEPVDLDLMIREDGTEQTTEGGAVIPWFDLESTAYKVEAGSEIDIVPPEGSSDTLFRLTPEECLDFAVDESSALDGFIKTHGRDSISGSRLRYPSRLEYHSPGPYLKETGWSFYRRASPSVSSTRTRTG
jgi:hypothetical protein